MHKLYYSIGEVAKIVGVEPYVLRYWEKEFKGLHPKRTRHKRRIYTTKDIDLLLLIKKLLYEDRYSLEGAKKKLNEIRKGENLNINTIRDIVQEVREELVEVLKTLE